MPSRATRAIRGYRVRVPPSLRARACARERGSCLTGATAPPVQVPPHKRHTNRAKSRGFCLPSLVRAVSLCVANDGATQEFSGSYARGGDTRRHQQDKRKAHSQAGRRRFESGRPLCFFANGGLPVEAAVLRSGRQFGLPKPGGWRSERRVVRGEVTRTHGEHRGGGGARRAATDAEPQAFMPHDRHHHHRPVTRLPGNDEARVALPPGGAGETRNHRDHRGGRGHRELPARASMPSTVSVISVNTRSPQVSRAFPSPLTSRRRTPGAARRR